MSRFPSEVIGSLLRPQYLLEARDALAAGRIDHSTFKVIEDRAVDAALALQAGCGLSVATDGEMRRLWFTGTLTEAIEGLEDVAARNTQWHGTGGDATLQAPKAITGKLRRVKSLATEEFSYARGHAHVPLKVTLPSPMMLLEFWSPEHSSAAYGDIFEVFADAVDILRAEAMALRDLGCRYIQIDAPELAVAIDPRQVAYYEAQGAERDRMFSEGIDLLNAVADVPGVRFAVHMCRGNHDGMWMSEGGYEAIAKEVFPRATNFDAFCLEYDDYRSGSFEPLRDVPDDKTVVLGLVSTKTDTVEPIDGLVARIDEAAKYFPREQLAVSTQCGFAPVAGGAPMSAETQERKLRTVAAVAEQALAA